MYESKQQPLISHTHFYQRVAWHLLIVLLLLLLSLGLGMVGYRVTEGLPWLDAFLNTAMLLGGMGPVDLPKTPGGKLFAGMFALYAGLLFIVCAALVLTPIIHRVLHHFHMRDR